MDSVLEISGPALAGFIRQHTHDVRNVLNSLDLEIALMLEVANDPETVQSATRMRTQLRKLGERLRALSAMFNDLKPTRAPITGEDMMAIWKEQLASMDQPIAVEWAEAAPPAAVNVDAGMVAGILRELLANASAFKAGEPARALSRAENGALIFELREPKREALDTSGWGERPFRTTRRGGYGLGLWFARRAAQANEGQLEQRGEPSELISRVSFPVAS